jgi:hypothetical protein
LAVEELGFALLNSSITQQLNRYELTGPSRQAPGLAFAVAPRQILAMASSGSRERMRGDA